MEKAMIQQLNLYLESHFPLHITVCAYRKNLSTEHAILKLLDTIYKNMDKQCVTLVLAIDLSAAFDTVNHSLLLKVLNKNIYYQRNSLRDGLPPIYQIAQSVYRLIIEYLRN